MKSGYNDLTRTVESVNYKTINEKQVEILVEEKYINSKSKLIGNGLYKK